jgi:hypothetical protein
LRDAPWHRLVALLAAVAISPAAASQLARHELQVAGSVQRVVAADLDGRGQPELLVFSVSGSLNPERRASVFAFDGGAPAPGPRTSWVLDQEGGIFDLGDDPQHGASLWYCTPGAVRRYRLQRVLEQVPAAETWLEKSSLLGGRSDEWVLFHDFAGDWHGDGREVPALFQPGRLVLPRFDGSEEIVLPLRTEIDTTAPPASYEMLDRLPLFLTHRIPSLKRLDVDGDARADIVAAIGDRLTVYSGADGTYAAAAPRHIRFPSGADPRDETRRQFVELADVTGDGRVDAVLSSLTGGFGNLTHELSVFRGEGRGFAETSANTLVKEGAASLTSLVDLDRDGRHEIVTVTVKIGIQALLAYLLTSRVPIEYTIYRVGADGKILPAPLIQWTRRVELQSTGATDPGVVALTGDFDGDGIDDVVSASGDGEIEIRRVVRGRDLGFGAVLAQLAAPGRGQALAPDLNGDGRDDLVVYVPRMPEGKVSVFISAPAVPVLKPARSPEPERLM